MAFETTTFNTFWGGWTTDLILWTPPGMEFGGSRFDSGYLVERAPAPGYNGRSFDHSVNTLFVPDRRINETPAAIPGVTSYSAAGLWIGNAGGKIKTSAAPGSPVGLINRPYRYGPAVHDLPSLMPVSSSLASGFDDDLVTYPFATWPGSQANLLTALPQTAPLIAFSADRSTIAPVALPWYYLVGSESYPVFGKVVRVNVDSTTGIAIDFQVSFGGTSSGQMTPTDAVAGLIGSAYARLTKYAVGGSTSASHRWKRIASWEDRDLSKISYVLAAVLEADAPFADFAFDVDFPAPIGNQRVVYTSESCAAAAPNAGLFVNRRAIPLLTRRTAAGSAPAAGYVRAASRRVPTAGYQITGLSGASRYETAWREDGACAGFLHAFFATSRWDADPTFNIQIPRPIPCFYELDQAVAQDVYWAPANEATDFEVCWGYFDAGVGLVPITTPVAGSLPGGAGPGVSLSIPVPTSIPAIPGMRYQLLSRRKVAPATSFDAWQFLYSSRGIGGAFNFLLPTPCLPRVYPFDAPKQHLLPSSADAVPVDHFGWSKGDYLFRASSQPTLSGTWVCDYVAASTEPWQVTGVASTVSGTPAYCAAWASVAGYRWRVQLPGWDSGKPVSRKSHFQANNLASGSRPWREDAAIDQAEFVIHRMAAANTGVGEDSLNTHLGIWLAPQAQVWSTIESRVTIAIP